MNDTSTENGTSNQNNDYSSSPTIVTKYAHKSARLIRSIEKNIFIIIGIIAVLVSISVIDTIEVLGITDLIGESLDDMIIAILSIASLAALFFMLRLLLNSRKSLEEWADMFERNSIRNSISMSLITSTKEDLVCAIADAVQELEEPLHEYLDKGDPHELFDVNTGYDIFDVLIDQDTVVEDKSPSLKRKLESYGAIMVKIVDGAVGKEEIKSLSDSLSKYLLRKRKRDAIGLAIIVGKEISPEALAATRSSPVQTARDILFIERP